MQGHTRREKLAIGHDETLHGGLSGKLGPEPSPRRRHETLSKCRISLLGLIAPALFAACSEENRAPTALSEHGPSTPSAVHSMHGQALEPFTFRAPLEPFRIHQLPDFMIHSTARKDIVFQRSIFNPGPGMWHTHPGPSFIYVIEGQIRLDRFSKKDGCTQTPVYQAGDGYFEVANEVHRAVVVSATPAVLLVTRFNMPVNGPITIPASNPGC